MNQALIMNQVLINIMMTDIDNIDSPLPNNQVNKKKGSNQLWLY